MTSYHARNINAMLRQADKEGVAVDEGRKREAQIAALREQADHIEHIRRDSDDRLDGALTDIERQLRVISEALEAGLDGRYRSNGRTPQEVEE